MYRLKSYFFEVEIAKKKNVILDFLYLEVFFSKSYE